MTFEPELHDALTRVVTLLERMGVPYAVGGAIAMAFAGHLRGTRDVDVLVLVPAIRTQEFADALNAGGFSMRDSSGKAMAVDVHRMTDSTRAAGHFRVWWKSTLVEVFSPKVPLQDSILKRRVQVTIQGTSLWITTAEDLMLLKMIFHRSKDLDDIRRMLAANQGRLDSDYLRNWAGKTLEPAQRSEMLDLLQAAESKP